MSSTLSRPLQKRILKTIKFSIIVKKSSKKCRSEELQTLNENSISQNNSSMPIKRTIMSGRTGTTPGVGTGN